MATDNLTNRGADLLVVSSKDKAFSRPCANYLISSLPYTYQKRERQNKDDVRTI